LSPPRALLALLENAFGLDEADPSVFEGLRRVALDVPCFDLVRGDVATADLSGVVDRVLLDR
jgi:hypothetical protein